MSARKLVPRRLSRDAFAPFGDVIQTDGVPHHAINNGTTERFHDLATVDTGEGEDAGKGRTLINIFVGQSFTPPVEIRMMERHPLGSQAFVPLDGRPYLVVVAPAREDGTPGTPVAFLASGDQGVNYARGTWHHPLVSLEAESRFLVVDRGGPGNNLEEADFPGDGFVVESV